jgi:UDP-N-acetylglucosamine diphosphorylase/glucosamine-1-phosphate N-acetyltransferase
MRRFAIFEDDAVLQFAPLALLRPVFELRCGHFTLRQRLLQLLEFEEWGALLRPELAETYRLEHPEAQVNDADWLGAGPVLLLNGRCLVEPHFLEGIRSGDAGWIGDMLAYVSLQPGDGWTPLASDSMDQLRAVAKAKRAVQVEGAVLSYPWDLVSQNSPWLEKDFQLRERPEEQLEPDSRAAILGPREDVVIHPTARIDPFVVIDASSGPVWIDEKVQIQAFTRIEGPAYIGPQTQLFRANVRAGCSFGPVCRLGGEIEETIVHGYANKYHDGFLGHSYVCPWVNLGALTTNSDLKNDYSQVSVPLRGTSIPAGSAKVGCFIGDHVKTGLGSLFNTGSSVGVMSLILPGGELLPKHIPPFSRVWHGKLEVLPDGCESGIATARLAMARRQRELTPAMERLLRWQFAATAQERQSGIARAASRR